jgi:hypothetical protein
MAEAAQVALEERSGDLGVEEALHGLFLAQGQGDQHPHEVPSVGPDHGAIEVHHGGPVRRFGVLVYVRVAVQEDLGHTRVREELGEALPHGVEHVAEVEVDAALLAEIVLSDLLGIPRGVLVEDIRLRLRLFAVPEA